jgi:CheY-like chemotaxis protein
MALTSLVVCADAKAVQVLSRVLEDLSIGVEHCGDPREAADRLTAKHFDVLLLDCEDETATMALLDSMAAISTKKRPLTIAIVDARNHVREIFARGSNFVLYKPVSPERVASSLRAARSLMPNERRRAQRVPVPAPVSIAYADVQNASAHLVNLSEDGVAIRSQRNVPPRCKVYFEFTLPDEVSVVRLSGEVVWQDALGRVGLRFARVPQASRTVLDSWLRQNLNRDVQGGPPALPTPQEAESDNIPRPAGLGLLAVSAADRRGKSRHACHLSADLFRAGSNTPQRCSLSDISDGGCYVETTEPFPSGTSVEIVVRTQELKLRVQGRVQASHPGFGMGVQFTLRTAHQRDQVKELIACQEAARETAGEHA